jgi:hypothetical protein
MDPDGILNGWNRNARMSPAMINASMRMRTVAVKLLLAVLR